ncbi:MAG: AzlD domain-containing protein [Tissierellia bacterium]|nr:AzlD domain-containing protein [Tissierellia bacterium]
MNNYLVLVLGMALVTYLPRLLPLYLLSDKTIGRRFARFLSYIPYTSLSILIVRGVISADKDMLLASLGGIFLAGYLSYKTNSLILSVLSAIGLAFVIKLFV